jgi:hypothetical protein
MFEDKLKTTDWDATNEAIEEQIARESYLQWARDNLSKNTQKVGPQDIPPPIDYNTSFFFQFRRIQKVLAQ